MIDPQCTYAEYNSVYLSVSVSLSVCIVTTTVLPVAIRMVQLQSKNMLEDTLQYLNERIFDEEPHPHLTGLCHVVR